MTAARYFLEMFGVSLGLTLLIELSLALLLGVRTKKGILAVILVNILTNPVAVYLCYCFHVFLPAGWYYPLQVFVEVLVVITEGLIYRSFREEEPKFHRPFLLAFILNTVSYGLGLLLNLLR